MKVQVERCAGHLGVETSTGRSRCNKRADGCLNPKRSQSRAGSTRSAPQSVDIAVAGAALHIFDQEPGRERYFALYQWTRLSFSVISANAPARG
jgi:hypothetical protein